MGINFSGGGYSGQAISTTDSPTFAGLTLTGVQNIAYGTISAPSVKFPSGTGIFGLTTGEFQVVAASSIRLLLTGGTGIGASNTSIGTAALYSLTSGIRNVAFGDGALFGLTTGSSNVAIGSGVMAPVTDGTFNTAVGYGAGAAMNHGTSVVLIGVTAGNANTADYTVAIGSGALKVNTTGTQNTAVGASSLFTNVSGANNSAFGHGSLFLNTGSQNTAGGNNALSSNTGSNNTAWGNEAGYRSGNPLPGTYDANAVTTGTYLTFVGFNAGLGSATQRTNSSAFGSGAYVNADNTVVLGDQNITQVLMGSASQASIALLNVVGSGYYDIAEMTAPAAPAANTARIYCVDNGGKSQLVCRFPSGAVQQLAIEP